MKRFLTFLFIVLFFGACGYQELTFSSQTFSGKTNFPCEEPCTVVVIEVPHAEGHPAADSINQTLFQVIRQIIYFGEKPYNASHYDDLTKSFIASFEELNSEFPDETMSWSASVEGEVSFHSPEIINITLTFYTYTGGAHGYSGIRSLFFSTETGKQISVEELFKDYEGFEKLAEELFRSEFKIPRDANINSTGYFFEGEIFSLPQNIIFNEEGVLLHYNTYEIASHVEGAQELLIPYKMATPYLKPF